MAYTLIEAQSAIELSQKVAAALAGGQTIQGDPVVVAANSFNTSRFFQAVGGEPLPATSAILANGATVAVRNSAGADSHNGTAVVAASAVTGVNLGATVAMVDNADAVTVQNSAGTAVAGSHAAAVSAGVLSNVKLAPTIAPVVNGATFPGVTGTGTTATITVANGVITGIALS